MIISNPFENPNALVHRYQADIILRLSANGINVFEFVKKNPGTINRKFKDIEFCDAKTVNEILLNKYVKVIVLNKDDRVLARNWVV